MKKLMVIVKHITSPQPYLFLVPDAAIHLNAGQLVKCQTGRGEQFGVCLCNSFSANPDVMCPLFGTAPEKMKYIVAEYDETRYALPEEDPDENG